MQNTFNIEILQFNPESIHKKTSWLFQNTCVGAGCACTKSTFASDPLRARGGSNPSVGSLWKNRLVQNGINHKAYRGFSPNSVVTLGVLTVMVKGPGG